VPDGLNLSKLKPAQKRVARKRVGRGLGSGKGRYSGRGLKGQKARSGSAKMRPGFEGGQMPIYMRLGKQRGPYSKDAMPVGPHRTHTQGVNVRELERVFDAGTEITPELLKERRLIRTTKIDLKILGAGDLTKALTIHAHGFSKTAREKIEQSGGTIVWLRGEPVPKAAKKRRKKVAAEADESTSAAEPQEEQEEASPGEEPEEEAEAEPEEEQD
jgi:large subunit ribosomal protein L15